MSEEQTNNTGETQTPPETQETQTQEQQTQEQETQKPSEDTKPEGLVFPDGKDADAVLAFRKSCGYPEAADGYGLPMDTEEQKSLVAFIHKCQLDPIAAKAVMDNVAESLKLEEQQSKQAYTEAYNKVVEGWGESKKENQSLMNKGMSLAGVDEDKLRAISDTLGVEAALSMMMLLGKTQTDHSGVSGGNSDDNESLLGYISRKRG